MCRVSKDLNCIRAIECISEASYRCKQLRSAAAYQTLLSCFDGVYYLRFSYHNTSLILSITYLSEFRCISIFCLKIMYYNLKHLAKCAMPAWLLITKCYEKTLSNKSAMNTTKLIDAVWVYDTWIDLLLNFRKVKLTFFVLRSTVEKRSSDHLQKLTSKTKVVISSSYMFT